MTAYLRFAQISDTHVKPDAIGRNQVFMDHLAEIQAGGYDFVIHTGDLMDEPSAWAARAFKAISSRLQSPLYCVPGNHDVYNPHMGGIEAPWWARLAVDSDLLAQYEAWFGPTWHTVCHDGVHLVALNSLIINSGLPEEDAQWSWLEECLADIAGRRLEHILLFSHLPLFIRHPFEHLDPADYQNRYLVIAPPGRDRLLGLIREHKVTAVFSGHMHVAWETSHSWPEGFATKFVSTGSSGVPSPMAIEHFGLTSTPTQGLGYHEHRLSADGLTSRYHQHSEVALQGRWKLGPSWMARCSNGRAPSINAGLHWYESDYCPPGQEWQEAPVAPRLPLPNKAGKTWFVRQAFEAETEAADLYLEILTEQAVEIYLNGEKLYSLKALENRPKAWQSAGGNHIIDSPVLSLGLNQRLVRKGRNVLALLLQKSEAIDGTSGEEEYVAFRTMEAA